MGCYGLQWGWIRVTIDGLVMDPLTSQQIISHIVTEQLLPWY